MHKRTESTKRKKRAFAQFNPLATFSICTNNRRHSDVKSKYRSVFKHE